MILVEGGVVLVNSTFNQHLTAVNDSLVSLSKSRRALSDKLRFIVEKAQKTLLETVDGEVDAIAAYSNFHDALFRLPALSKERINSCIAEIEALLSGVDAMTQSEIEALSVVWEALNVSSGERGTFWGEVEEEMQVLMVRNEETFQTVTDFCAVDGEEWVLRVATEAVDIHRNLEARLFKLEKIHKEVEKLRARQDVKSKIISLDSEIRILSAKLSKFEDEKCNKQRLLTKKAGSSTLLKEERFRKHMQQKFFSKLADLANLLRSWRNEERKDIDENVLSDEVRMLLKNSKDMDTWVEARTEFMHLRTVKASKRRVDGPKSGATPPRKRQATLQLHANAADVRPSPKITKEAAREGVAEQMRRSLKRKEVGKPSTPVTDSKVPRRQLPTGMWRQRLSPKRNKLEIVPENTNVSPNKKRTLPPFGHVLEQAESPVNKRSSNKRLTLPPFGHLLDQSPGSTSASKENAQSMEG